MKPFHALCSPRIDARPLASACIARQRLRQTLQRERAQIANVQADQALLRELLRAEAPGARPESRHS